MRAPSTGMASWKGLLTAASLSLAAASAAASDATVYPTDTVPDWQASSALSFQVSDPGADLPAVFTVVPLTSILGLNSSRTQGFVPIVGELVEATATNYANISGSSEIAFLCCDNTTSSFIDANRIFNALVGNLPAAIVLYSQTNDCCQLGGSGLAYQAVFSMVAKNEAAQALNLTDNGDGAAQATIGGKVTSSDSGSGGGGSNSAVAMSILYSITGLITLLFLIIIATGAVRAHRNPERYGPRSGHGGRPRQSRAKGLARAVLETLPIVKFGDDTPAKPDPSIELDASASAESGLGRRPQDVPARHLSAVPEDAGAQPETAGVLQGAAAGSSANGTAPAGTTASSAKADDDSQLGCPICTEDFAVGEDVRVLPCNHKYHPHCVDPWLVNVSGTCPLCRLDLRPNAGEADAAVDGEAAMAPPLDAEAESAAAAAATAADASSTDASGAGSHRRTRLFDLHRLRHATVEERIEALRRYRTENQTQGSAEAGPGAASNGEDHAGERLTRRLRDKFRIRTRAQSPTSSRRS